MATNGNAEPTSHEDVALDARALMEQRMSRDISREMSRDMPRTGSIDSNHTNGHASPKSPSMDANSAPFDDVNHISAAKSKAMILSAAPNPITVDFSSVDAWVDVTLPPGSIFFGSKGDAPAAAPTTKQILYNISGSIRPGEVLALMGPSGSGKTSLLSILGGRSTATVKGNVTFNGKPMSKKLKRMMGFVTQDDQLLGNLTVYETLLYAALLRLPRDMTREEKEDRVDQVIEGLGLSKCRGTIIGGFDRRGISGGERKRVSIGHELLINPALLLCDEPTSGLDSTTALRLVHTLRSLAKAGRTVVTTIHQPSSQAFHLLDNLTLLSEGHALFYGQAHDASAYFAKIGPKLPYGVNAADFLLDIASGEIDPIPSSEVEGLREGGDAARLALIESRRELSASEASARGEAMLKAAASFKNVEGGPRWAASWTTQCQVLFIRTLKQRRFDALDNLKIFQTLVISTVIGMLWWQKGENQPYLERDVVDVAGLIFFEGVFMSFLSMFGAIFTFPTERLMLIKERRSAMYRLSSYYAARTAADIPLEVVVPTIFVFIMYWMSGLEANFWVFIAHWMSVLLTVFVAQSAGLLVGAGMMNLKAAQTVASIAMLTVMLCGGYYVQDVPVWISWVRHLSFITYNYQILAKLQFGGKSYDCGVDKLCRIGESGILGEVKVDDSVAMDVLALFIMLVALRSAVYVALKFRVKG